MLTSSRCLAGRCEVQVWLLDAAGRALDALAPTSADEVFTEQPRAATLRGNLYVVYRASRADRRNTLRVAPLACHAD